MRTLTGEMTMEKIIKKIAIGMIIASMSTQVSLAASKGESGGQFLRLGVGARAAGMGGAFSSLADDVTALYWNPAGLAQMETKQVSVSYNAYFEDTSAQFIGYAHPTENHGTWSGSVRLFSVTDIERRSITGDADAPDLGSFDTQDMVVSLGWASRAGNLNYGASLKYISSDLEIKDAQTGAIDVGTLYNFNGEKEGLRASLAVLNIGGELKFDEEGDPLPLNVKPGLAYRWQFEKLGYLTGVLDADLLVNDGIGFVQPGFEWQFVRQFALRGGYQIGRDDDAGEGLGVGIGVNVLSLGLDYAFVPFGELGDTHRVSLGVKF